MNISMDGKITNITDNDWLPLPIDVSEKPEICHQGAYEVKSVGTLATIEIDLDAGV